MIKTGVDFHGKVRHEQGCRREACGLTDFLVSFFAYCYLLRVQFKKIFSYPMHKLVKYKSLFYKVLLIIITILLKPFLLPLFDETLVTYMMDNSESEATEGGQSSGEATKVGQSSGEITEVGQSSGEITEVGQGSGEATEGDLNSIHLRLDNINEKLDTATEAARIIADILQDDSVRLAVKTGSFGAFCYGVHKILSGIPHPGWKTVCGISSVWAWSSVLILENVLSHSRKKELIKKLPDQTRLDDYVERLTSRRSSHGSDGPTGGGGSTGGPIGRIDSSGNGVRNASEGSAALVPSAANTASAVDDGVDTTTSMGDPYFNIGSLTGGQKPALPPLKDIKGKTLAKYSQELQEMQAETNSNSLVIRSPAEETLWESLLNYFSMNMDNLSLVEVGLYVANISLLLLHMLAVGLSILLIRNRLIEFLANRKGLPLFVSKWIPFFKNRLISSISTMVLLYGLVLMLILVSRVGTVLSIFDSNIEGVAYPNELKSHLLNASRVVSFLYLTITLISVEIIKNKVISLFSSYVKLPEFVKNYSIKQPPLMYMVLLLGALLVSIDYLLYLFTTVLPDELQILNDFLKMMECETRS
jgi:hypothetical protein